MRERERENCRFAIVLKEKHPYSLGFRLLRKSETPIGYRL